MSVVLSSLTSSLSSDLIILNASLSAEIASPSFDPQHEPLALPHISNSRLSCDNSNSTKGLDKSKEQNVVQMLATINFDIF
jgi:hypothetical protein